MSFADDLKFEAASPAMNATAVWLDGQDESIQSAFMSWLQAGKSRAALFRTCQRYGLEHITATSTFREHCRDILESGRFDQT